MPKAKPSSTWSMRAAALLAPRIVYVYGKGVVSALQYAIDQNLAPIISLSFGICEIDVAERLALVSQPGAAGGRPGDHVGRLFGGHRRGRMRKPE